MKLYRLRNIETGKYANMGKSLTGFSAGTKKGSFYNSLAPIMIKLSQKGVNTEDWIVETYETLLMRTDTIKEIMEARNDIKKG